jgi:ribulose-phosphate 3-epimerase
MIEDPNRYIAEFTDAGANIITVHAEACTHLDRTIENIKSHGVRAGVALNPATPIESIRYILPKLDMVLIMTVNPGFGGQKLIPYTLQKVRDLKEMIDKQGLDIDIEVDGGITADNVQKALDAGANVIVAGSAVFNGNLSENTKEFLQIFNKNN